MNYRVQSGDYTNLRKLNYGGLQHASLCPNTIKVKCQTNATENVPFGSYVENEVHNFTIGAYTDALPGRRLAISHTASLVDAFWQGRVRALWNSTQMQFNEMCIDNGGNDYVFVVDDYPIMEKLIYFSNNDHNYYVDWNIAFRRLRPIIGANDDNIGLKGAYANYVDKTSGKFRISVSAYIYAIESASTISSWGVNIADGTLISGAISGSGQTTGVITIDFPAGFRHVRITGTDNNGNSTTLSVRVWAEPLDGSSTTLINNFGGSDINFDLNTPATCTLTDFDTDFQGILPNSLICLWDEEYIDDTLGSVGGNVRFLGRLRKSENKATSDLNYHRILENPWTIEGIESQINRLDPMKTFNLNTKIPPVIWGDIQSMNPYRILALLLTEFTTLAETCPINFDVWSDLFPYPAWNTAGSTMLEVFKDIGLSVNANLVFSPDGRIEFNRHAFYLSAAERTALHTIANWTNQDAINTNYQKTEFNEVSIVDAWGAEGQVATALGPAVIPQHAAAPGIAREPGERSLQLNKQILANAGLANSQTELNDRAGCYREKEGLPERIIEGHTDQYGFLTPSNNEWVTETLSAADLDLEGVSFDTSTRWLIEKVHQSHHNETFTKDVEITYIKETNGIGKGKTLFIDDPSSNTQAYPSTAIIDPIIALPAPPDTLPGIDVLHLKKGIKLIAAPSSGGDRYRTSNFDQSVMGSAPSWLNAALGVSGTVLQWVPDAFSTRYTSSTGKTYGWIITTTHIYYGELNTPSFTSFFTFRASSSLRSADASILVSGHIFVSTDYSDGTYVTYATTGGNFVAEISIGAGGGLHPPGAFCSQHTVGTYYSSCVGLGKRSTDAGATWSSFGSIAPGSDCAADIAVPYQGNTSDAALYYTASSATSSTTFDLTSSASGWTSLVGTDADHGYYFGLYCTGALSAGWFSGSGFKGLISPGGGCGCGAVNSVNYINLLSSAGYVFNGVTSVDITVDAGSLTLGFIHFFYQDLSGTWHETGSGYVPSGVSTLTVTFSANIQGLSVNLGTCDQTSLTYITKVVVHTTNPTRDLKKYDGASASTVSPLPQYAPWKSRGQIAISPTNSSVVVCCAGNVGLTQTGVWLSLNGGTSWVALSGPSNTNPWTRAFISGDGNNVIYLVGLSGEIGAVYNLLLPIIQKIGNITTGNELMGLAGL